MDLNGKPVEAMPYMDPISTTDNDHLKTISSHNFYCSADQAIKSDIKLVEAMPYVDPTNATVKNHLDPRASCDDCKVPPPLNVYEKPAADYLILNKLDQYELDATLVFRDNKTEDMADGQIYEDPGHKKEDIYSLFEEKKFQELKRNDIKCVELNIEFIS